MGGDTRQQALLRRFAVGLRTQSKTLCIESLFAGFQEDIAILKVTRQRGNRRRLTIRYRRHQRVVTRKLVQLLQEAKITSP
jgi:hypothetical protein